VTTLAVLATIPRREHLLPRVLGSIRPQVDRLCVYLNGYREVPDCLRGASDEFILDPVNGGAERKLHWALSCDGVYLSVDDDIVYPADYAHTMLAAVERWDGRAIVSAHGRVYTPRARKVSDVEPGSIGIFNARCREQWVNHAGTGCMAWDTRKVRVPAQWPESNIADMQLAIWAQLNRVPIWRVAHDHRWLRGLAAVDPYGLFGRSQRDGHMRRNDMLSKHSREHGWRLYQC
jgi:hypothetical protein